MMLCHACHAKRPRYIYIYIDPKGDQFRLSHLHCAQMVDQTANSQEICTMKTSQRISCTRAMMGLDGEQRRQWVRAPYPRCNTQRALGVGLAHKKLSLRSSISRLTSRSQGACADTLLPLGRTHSSGFLQRSGRSHPAHSSPCWPEAGETVGLGYSQGLK